MADTILIGRDDLGSDFDQGQLQTDKINVVNASTTVAGKARFATTAEITSGAAGVIIDAATFNNTLPMSAKIQLTDAFGNIIGNAMSSNINGQTIEMLALVNMDSVFDIGNLVTNKISVQTFGPSSSVVAGTRGLVPAPAVNQGQHYVLCADAQWRQAVTLNDDGSLTVSYTDLPTVAPNEGTLVQLSGGINADAIEEIYAFGSVGTPRLRGFKYDGTAAEPTATLANQVLLSLEAGGYNGSTSEIMAMLQFIAAEDWTSSANGTLIELLTTPKGTTTPAVALTVNDDASIVVGAATGGKQGASTVNAEGLFINGQPCATQDFVLSMAIALG
jgi:hypothetical protein